jgi:hypothetical protein
MHENICPLDQTYQLVLLLLEVQRNAPLVRIQGKKEAALFAFISPLSRPRLQALSPLALPL